MSDIFSIGMRGLLAYQAAIAVTGQNIANVKTPYYSRREINFAEDLFGNGVNISDVRRVYDEAASRYLLQSNSAVEMSSVLYTQISELESLLGSDIGDDNKTTISAFINDALSTLRDLNGDAGSIQSRSNYLSKLNNLSKRFQVISDQINQRGNVINQSLSKTTETINAITKQLAEINKQIANSNGQDISALLDLQESQMQELAKYINFSSKKSENGEVSVLLDNGIPLVNGVNSYSMSTAKSSENPNKYVIQVTTGTITSDITGQIHSGQLSGLFKSKLALDQAQNGLGRLSLAFRDTINKQNKLGIDLNGNLGSNIFNDINNTKATKDRVITNSNNMGSADLSVNIDNISSLTTSDYSVVFDSPTHYTIKRLSDNTTVSTGDISGIPDQISVDGFSIQINSGSISSGDQFIISPTRNAALDTSVTMTDPKQLALAWPVSGNANVSNKGSGSILVSDITDTTNSSFSTPGQLNPPIKIRFISDTSFEIVNANTNSVIEGPISYDPSSGLDVFPTAGAYDPGYRIHLSGNILSGDEFNVNYNTNPAGDNRNGLKMEELYNKGILDDNSLTFTKAYFLVSGDVANQVSSAKVNFNSNLAVHEKALQQFGQISGVSIQEESTNLAMYQECYQASAQIIQAAKTVFDTIIAIGR